MLKAGFARLNVTPPLGNRIAGYFYERLSDGVLDPIEINLVAVSNGEDTVIIAAADFCAIKMVQCDIFRKMVGERCGLPADHVFISCLHQHTSSTIKQPGFDPEMQKIEDPEYVGIFARKLCDAAQLAMDDMCEAEVSCGTELTCEPVSFVRRYIMDDGSVMTNPRNHSEHIVRPVCEADNNVRLVRFRRKDAKDIALVSFSTHPDVIGGTKYSADWCGFVRRFVEADIGDVCCAFVTGAEGDTNHVDFMGDYEKTNRKYLHSEHMGRVIADAVISMWDKTRPCDGDNVYGGMEIVYNKTRTDGEERYEECKAICDRYDTMTTEEKRAFGALRISSALRIVNMRTAPIYRAIPITVVSFASIAFVGFGGEPFIHYAEAIRDAHPDKFVVAACLTNGSEGYLPTKSAFAEGGYEAGSSEFTPELEEQCVAAAGRLIDGKK